MDTNHSRMRRGREVLRRCTGTVHSRVHGLLEALMDNIQDYAHGVRMLGIVLLVWALVMMRLRW